MPITKLFSNFNDVIEINSRPIITAFQDRKTIIILINTQFMKKPEDFFNTISWYDKPSTDPYRVIAELYNTKSIRSWRETIGRLLISACSNNMYNHSDPGDLIADCQMLQSLFYAARSLNKEKKNLPLIKEKNLFDPIHFRGSLKYISDWDYLPRALSIKEYSNPYHVFRSFFKKWNLKRWKRVTREILQFALRKTNILEEDPGINTIFIYLQLIKLLEAAFLIDLRENNKSESHIRDRYSPGSHDHFSGNTIEEPCVEWSLN